MTKGRKKADRGEETRPKARPLLVEIWGIVLITVGLCLFLALISFSRVDIHREGEVVNLIGPVGVQVASLALKTVGLCAFFLDAVFFVCGFGLLFGRRIHPGALEAVGYTLAIPTGSVFLHLVFEDDRVLGYKAGGFMGELGAEIGRSLLGSVGTVIFTTAVLVMALTLIAETNPSILGRRTAVGIYRGSRRLLTRSVDLIRRVARVVRSVLEPWMATRQRTRSGRAEFEEPVFRIDDPHYKEECEVPDAVTAPPPDKGTSESKPVQPVIKPPPQPRRSGAKSPSDRQIELSLELVDPGAFATPDPSLLTAPPTAGQEVDQDKLMDTANRLERAFKEFRIDGKITGITPGPVVTMFEYEPAAGVKLSTIANLAADLARVIKAQSVRIVAPIPGKGVVGLEVPNDYRMTVYLRELIEDPTFQQSRAKLPLAIGKDITGRPVITDLSKMPHLLVAGATGSGKSVAINAMVTSLLYRAEPDEVRLILVDPKMLELNVYEGIPHLLVPVVTDPKKAATALRWAVDEMERRYHCLSTLKVRNIHGYNKEVRRIQPLRGAQVPDEVEVDAQGVPLIHPLPYIVIVIDEFADLMMVAPKDVEMCVARLAQKARAAGVHLILATQRPSVDVITGLIKANFPTRISFRVFSRIDSRTVLDTQGAESLLGMGDMLFRPPGRGDLVRAHGAYVDEKEIIRVVEHLKTQGQPEYREEILLSADSNDLDPEAEEVDEMYDQAVQVVTSERKASISMVQRKLRVGYNRAARMIEMMEREGIVGPSDGRGGREVFAPPPPPL